MFSSIERSAVTAVLTLTASLFLAIFLVIDCQAQTTTSIRGTVVDERGAKVAGASVQLRPRAGRVLAATTDHDGVFEFRNLNQGIYLLEIAAEGFSHFVSDSLDLTRGASESLNFQLEVAAVNETVIVTATGTAQRTDEVAKVISVIDSEQIDNKRELGLAEALRGTAGVRIQQQGSPGALTSIRLRGQRTFDTAVLLDGLRVRDAGDINGSAASLITDLTPVAMERVEILRGSGSSIYGTNAIGGVLNLVPEIGSGTPHFEIGAEGGGLATFRERFKLAGGNQSMGYGFGINRTDVRRGIDGEDEYGNTSGGGRLQFNPSASVSLEANGYATISNSRLNDSPFPLDAAFSGSQSFPDAISGTTFQPDFNNPDQGRRNRLLVGSLRFTHQVRSRLSYTVAYQRVSSDRENYNGPEIDQRFAAFYPFGDFEFVNISRGTTDTLDARLNGRLGRSHLITGGIEFENESAFQQFKPPYVISNMPRDRQRTFAVFGQDLISLLQDRLQISVGVRHQSYHLRAADRPGFLEAINTTSSLTGDGAIAYFLRSSNTKLRAHIGNGFRAPSLYERFGVGRFQGAGFTRFGDPTLKAEQSVSVDGGFDQRLAKDRVLFGATYFYTRLQRVIGFKSFLVDPLGLGRSGGFSNQPGGVSRGVETYLEATPVRGTQLSGSYTFTNSDRSLTGRGLQPEFVIPTHVIGFNWNQLIRAFAINLDVHHSSSHIAPLFENNYPFRSAEMRFSAYTKVDFFARYERRLSEKVSAVFFAGADNILNQEYFENGFRAPGVVGRGGVNFKF
jgi:iron complex outermembrane receptor protein